MSDKETHFPKKHDFRYIRKSDTIITEFLREDRKTMNTPVLATERLLLRPFHADDAEAAFACWESDPEVAKYMFWTSHYEIEKTREWIEFEVGQIPRDDWYRFAIVLKETDELIGTGLIYYEKEVSSWEIGYNLKKILGNGLCHRGNERDPVSVQ